MNSTSLRNRILLAIGASTLAGASSLHCGGTTENDLATDSGADATADSDSPGGGSGSILFGMGGLPDAAGGAATGRGGSGGRLTIRRPFLVGTSLRAAGTAARGDWLESMTPPGFIDPITRDALAQAWLDDATQEHASVAAFARFTMLLLSVGAPPELVLGSQRASLDEVAHAKACFGLAARYDATSRGPGSLTVHDALAPLSLAEIAALTAEEGCVGETLGVLLAQEQLAVASDTTVVRVLKKIVADEARHAELAWSFVAWAIGSGGDDVLDAVERAAQRAIVETRRVPLRDYGVDPEAWHAHGRTTCAEARRVSERGIRDVVEPALRALRTKPQRRDATLTI